MKPNVHPNYQEITLIMTNGEEFITKSALCTPKLLLDVDFRSHPAWSGALSQVNSRASAVASFNKKFSGINFGAKKSNP